MDPLKLEGSHAEVHIDARINHGSRTVDPLKQLQRELARIDEAELTTVLEPWTH